METEKVDVELDVAELLKRIAKLERTVRENVIQLNALNDSFAALKKSANLPFEVRPPLVFKDRHGHDVPVQDLTDCTPETLNEIPRVGSNDPIILKMPMRRKLALQALVEAKAGEPLFVLFHGALQVGEQSPRFERVRSMRSSERSFIAIADPTVELAEELNLGWYVGHDSFDLRSETQRLVAGLTDVLKPSQLVFIGSSGGGFAALQLASEFPESLAFVTDPQIVVPDYYAGHVGRLLKHAFSRMAPEEAMGEFGERLSVIEKHKKHGRPNYVFYCQHQEDEFHREKHMTPFARFNQVSIGGGHSPDGQVYIELFPEHGHGPLRGSLFDTTLTRALDWHRQKLTSN